MRTIIENAVCGIASVVITTIMVAASAPAAASVPSDAPRAVVQTAELDLGSSAGRATAESRIHAATDRVCGAAATTVAQARCRHDALAAAMQGLQTQVDARHDGAVLLAGR